MKVSVTGERATIQSIFKRSHSAAADTSIISHLSTRGERVSRTYVILRQRFGIRDATEFTLITNIALARALDQLARDGFKSWEKQFLELDHSDWWFSILERLRFLIVHADKRALTHDESENLSAAANDVAVILKSVTPRSDWPYLDRSEDLLW